MALPAIHPGEHLAEELEALDMSAAELARTIDVPTNRVTQILNGTRIITGDSMWHGQRGRPHRERALQGLRGLCQF